jgi:uncharacterized membrane protein
MTEQERDELMDKLEALRQQLADARQELESQRLRVADIEDEIMRTECRFTECRYWPATS